jgi:hypothetical protein
MEVPVPEWVWIVLASVVTGAFLAWFIPHEWRALANKVEGDTFSEYIRAWIGVKPKDRKRQWGIGVFLALFVALPVWFVPHILWELW